MKKVWFFASLAAAWLCGAATVALNTLRASEDAPLEPSIQNEVDHAISLAARAVERLEGASKAESREETALRLIQSQRGDGTWEGDTLLTTRANLAILESL